MLYITEITVRTMSRRGARSPPSGTRSGIPGDLLGRQAAHRAQGERELCGLGQRRMAASEQQWQSLVHFGVDQRRPVGEDRELLAVALVAAQPIECVVARSRGEPRGRIRRDSPHAPSDQRFGDSLGHGFLREIEVAERCGQSRDDPGGLASDHPLQGAIGCRIPR